MLPTDNTRRPLDRRAVLMTLGLCMIWGAQQAAMKAVATEVAPLMQLSIRFAFAAAFFGAWVLLEEGPGAFGDGTLPGGALMGLLFTLEFVLVGEALVYTSASHTIVFLYTSPIFTALGVRFLPDERLRREQWLGIAIAFLGIVIAFVGPGHRAVTDLMVGDFLALLAGAAWGLSNVVLRRSRLSGASTAKTVLYQVGIAAPLLFAVAAATGQTHLVFTAAAIASLAFQTLVISTSSYLLWFWMLRHYLTSRLMLMLLLTPLFGVAFGAAFLGEAVESRFAMGALMVLAGILAVNGRSWSRKENG